MYVKGAEAGSLQHPPLWQRSHSSVFIQPLFYKHWRIWLLPCGPQAHHSPGEQSAPLPSQLENTSISSLFPVSLWDLHSCSSNNR